MPEINDPERGLKISFTDDDYKDYQEGNLSDDFYARRTDGSIANKVEISPLNNDTDGDQSGEFDASSAVKGGLIVAAFFGAVYGIKKLWNRHKANKATAQEAEQNKLQNDFQENITQIPSKPINTMLSPDTVKSNDTEQKSLTQEDAMQEIMKIIVGMAEIADGNKKVSEGIENLSNAGIVDREALLKKLSDPKVLEGFNAYLENNPQLVVHNQIVFSAVFGRNLAVNGQYVPLTALDIERELRNEYG